MIRGKMPIEWKRGPNDDVPTQFVDKSGRYKTYTMYDNVPPNVSFSTGYNYIRPSRDEIIPGLWVGNKDACASFPGQCIAVTEHSQCQNSHCENIPIITEKSDTFADKKQLEIAARRIIRLLNEGHEVMVHCWVGMERSPLTVTWTLAEMMGYSLDEAFDIVRSRRTIAANRLHWVTEEVDWTHGKMVAGYGTSNVKMVTRANVDEWWD